MDRGSGFNIYAFMFFLILLLGAGCATHESQGSSYSHGESSKKGQSIAPAHTKPYQIAGQTYHPIASARGFSQTGKASWYGKKFHGRKTANGETYNMYAMTAAHKTLPIGTWVRVDNLLNKKNVVVRVNDRGPFVRGRIIDLSYTSAKKIDLVGPGTAPVRVTALGLANGDPYSSKNPVTYIPLNYFKGNFTVQVGAFKDETNANRLKTKLGKSYTNAHIVAYTDYRGLFYRVRVGKYSTLASAELFENQLILEGVKNAFAVAE